MKLFTFLLVCQSLVALNDSIVRFMLLGLASVLLTPQESSEAISLIAFILILPYLLMAPLAGWISDRFAKSAVIRWTVAVQLLGLILLSIGIWIHSWIALYTGFGLLAVQSAFFSPAKKGILKELIGGERLGLVIGIAELFTVFSILMGGWLGGWGFEFFRAQQDGSVWAGAGWTTAGVGLLAMGSFLLTFGIEKTKPQGSLSFSPSIIFRHFHDLRLLWQNPALFWCACSIALVWGLGYFLTLVLMNLGKDMAPETAASTSGAFTLWLGLGVILGSGLGSYFSRKQICTPLVTYGSLGQLLSLWGLAVSTPSSGTFCFSLIALGSSMGLFVIPFTALLQRRAPDDQRGSVIAVSNLINNLGFLLVVGLQALLGVFLEFSWVEQITFSGFFMVVFLGLFFLKTPEIYMHGLVGSVTRLIYRIKVKGLDKIPQKGGVLLISNHISYVDVLILSAICPRPIRFMSFDRLSQIPGLGFFLQLAGAIPVSSQRVRGAISDAVATLRAGEVVCIFPEGQMSRRGSLLGLQRGYQLIARQANCPILPVYLDGLWGSIFSFYKGKYFFKKPERFPYPVSVEFANIMKDHKSPDLAREKLLDLGESAFHSRKICQRHLGDLTAEKLCQYPRTPIISDCTGKTPRIMKSGMLLALACTLSKKIRQEIPGQRVGIALPPGIAGHLTNLAVSLAGKIPVNLNFTMGSSAVKSCIEQSEVERIITARAIQSKAPKFPWTDQDWDILEVLKKLSKCSTVLWLLGIRFLPWFCLRPILGTPKRGGDREAGLLFSSGSTGDPKGVVLSHRNIITNCLQVAECGILPPKEKLLASLPLFHSFGFTVTIWFPLIQNLPIITVPSPLEVKKIAQVIEDFKVTFLLGTPTFLRPYFGKVDPSKLKSLKAVVAGAEKTPQGFAENWEKKMGSFYLEGYGLTETAPVISVNVPNPPPFQSRISEHQYSQRIGSTGRMLPGISARIRNPETGELLSLTETGILEIRGANVFTHYLKAPESTAACLQNGWFYTGDLARFDNDGFLYIEGRLSRFSKIGGEMVPHGKIESEINQIYGVAESESLHFAVSAKPDLKKGETLVLLTTDSIDLTFLQKKLLERGIAQLWIPKLLQKVPEIPCLSTGKMDLKKIKEIAENHHPIKKII